jgi:hypothetical protein
MKKLITILILILFSTLVKAQSDVYYVDEIKESSKLSIADGHADYHGLIVKQANEDWQGDYVMIAYEIKKQCKALFEFLYLEKPAGMTEKTFEKIRGTAMLDWTKLDSNNVLIEADWTMVLHVTKRQLEAYLEIF